MRGAPRYFFITWDQILIFTQKLFFDFNFFFVELTQRKSELIDAINCLGYEWELLVANHLWWFEKQSDFCRHEHWSTRVKPSDAPNFNGFHYERPTKNELKSSFKRLKTIAQVLFWGFLQHFSFVLASSPLSLITFMIKTQSRRKRSWAIEPLRFMISLATCTVVK